MNNFIVQLLYIVVTHNIIVENACYCDPDEDWAAGYRNLCYYAITQGLPSCIPIP